MKLPLRMLGLDPGSTHLGWCAVEMGTPPIWLAGGAETWLGFPTLAGILMIAHELRVDGYCVEDMSCAFGIRPTVVRALIESAQIAGYIRGRIEASNLACQTASSYEWRKAIVGCSNAKGSQIEHALRELEHMDLPKRTNVHSRDACGLAIYCARMLMEKRNAPLLHAV